MIDPDLARLAEALQISINSLHLRVYALEKKIAEIEKKRGF